MTSKVHTLDKKTRRRHFPEFDGGKGSHPRSSTRETRAAYKDNFDKIDMEYKGKSFIKSSN